MPEAGFNALFVRGSETPDHRKAEESVPHGNRFRVIFPAGVVDGRRYLHLPAHAVGERDPQIEDLVSPALHGTMADPVTLAAHFVDFLRDGNLLAVFRCRVRQQVIAAHKEEIERSPDSEQMAQPVYIPVVGPCQPIPPSGKEGYRSHGSADGHGNGQPPDDPGLS